MLKVSVIIPTHNRPDLLPKAIKSVLNQSYQDFEVIVVDDGLEIRAESIVKKVNDSRIVYIQHETERGGAAARNTGIKAAQGEFIAFLDDDDEWLPKKLEIQMSRFRDTNQEVGFCFSAVKIVKNKVEEFNYVPEGIANYYEDILRRFKGFLTSTLIVKKYVFNKVGIFDELLPSHQEVDLMIKMSKSYKGLGINQHLISMMGDNSNKIGADLKKRIRGREMILNKYLDDFKKRPKLLARHYFWLGLMYRDDKRYLDSREFFYKALKLNFKIKYLLHYINIYRLN